jgi:hypothetical protein
MGRKADLHQSHAQIGGMNVVFCFSSFANESMGTELLMPMIPHP